MIAEYEYADDIEIDVLDLNEITPEMLNDFKCGNQSLDDFLHEEAYTDSAKTYLFVDINQNTVIAFASIACSAIMFAIENDDHDILFASERYSLSPAIEIKYFAMDKKYRHLCYSDAPKSKITLSCNLFRYVVSHIQDIANEHVGAEYIVLYSVPEAQSFYARNMFNRFDQEMYGNSDPYLQGCIPMYMEI